MTAVEPLARKTERTTVWTAYGITSVEPCIVLLVLYSVRPTLCIFMLANLSLCWCIVSSANYVSSSISTLPYYPPFGSLVLSPYSGSSGESTLAFCRLFIRLVLSPYSGSNGESTLAFCHVSSFVSFCRRILAAAARAR